MLDCLILGDSIAVGVAQARPGCGVSAQVGITSGAFMQSLFPTAAKAAKHVVISLGVNDDAGVDTPGNLRRLRSGITAGRVTWLLPGLKDTVRQHVRTVAAENRDAVVDTISQVGPDRLHPGRDGYRRIATWTEEGAPAPPQPAPTLLRRYAGGPVVIPMPGSARPVGLLPQVQTPGAIYGAWPMTTAPFAAIPPRDYAFKALPSRGSN